MRKKIFEVTIYSTREWHDTELDYSFSVAVNASSEEDARKQIEDSCYDNACNERCEIHGAFEVRPNDKSPAIDLTSETDDRYWDCECESDYNHKKSDVSKCDSCGAIQDEQPDSLVDELTDIVDEDRWQAWCETCDNSRNFLRPSSERGNMDAWKCEGCEGRLVI